MNCTNNLSYKIRNNVDNQLIFNFRFFVMFLVITYNFQVCKILQYINSLLSALVKAEYWDLALRLFLQSALICDLMGIQTAGYYSVKS